MLHAGRTDPVKGFGLFSAVSLSHRLAWARTLPVVLHRAPVHTPIKSLRPVKAALDAAGVAWIELATHEGDDVIATLTHTAVASGRPTTCYRDLYQLLDHPSVTILTPSRARPLVGRNMPVTSARPLDPSLSASGSSANAGDLTFGPIFGLVAERSSEDLAALSRTNGAAPLAGLYRFARVPRPAS